MYYNDQGHPKGWPFAMLFNSALPILQIIFDTADTAHTVPDTDRCGTSDRRPAGGSADLPVAELTIRQQLHTAAANAAQGDATVLGLVIVNFAILHSPLPH